MRARAYGYRAPPGTGVLVKNCIPPCNLHDNTPSILPCNTQRKDAVPSHVQGILSSSLSHCRNSPETRNMLFPKAHVRVIKVLTCTSNSLHSAERQYRVGRESATSCAVTRGKAKSCSPATPNSKHIYTPISLPRYFMLLQRHSTPEQKHLRLMSIRTKRD